MDPFLSVPPHFRHRSGLIDAWLTEPLGVFTRLSPGSHMTDAMASFFTDELEHALNAERRRSGTKAALYVHDWGGMRSYDSAARQRLIAWPLRLGRAQIAEIVMVVAPDTPRFVRMAYDVGGAAVAVAGIQMSVVDDVAATVDRLVLRPRPS